MPCHSDVLHMFVLKGRISGRNFFRMFICSGSKVHDFDCELMVILPTSFSVHSWNSSKVIVAVSRNDWTGQPPEDRCTLAMFSLKKSINSCPVGHPLVGVFVRSDPISVEIDCYSFLG